MLTLPPEPSAKEPISATFIRALMRYIRANTLLNGPGYRTKRGPNGTVLSIDKSAKNETKIADLGRFAIDSIKDTMVIFKNEYCDVGAKTYYLGGQSCTVYEEGSTFICLIVYTSSEPSVPMFSVVAFKSFNEMQAAQNEHYQAVIPLYKFEDGALECDFRTGPTVPAWEFSS